MFIFPGFVEYLLFIIFIAGTEIGEMQRCKKKKRVPKDLNIILIRV